VAVTVRLFAAARAAVGVSELMVSAGTLGSVLDETVVAGPGLGNVLPQCSFLVNEVSCRDMTMAVSDGDVVDVLPPFAGG